MANTPNIFILSRNNYNAFPDKDHNIFFVRENSSSTSDVLSLYVGEARQCDIWDLSGVPGIDIGDPEHNYNIPNTYWIQDKLFFYGVDVSVGREDNEDITEKYFKLMLYDGTRFIDCGIRNNVIVCDNLPANPINDFVYIQPSTKAISVYESGQWVQLLDLSQYALATDIPQADGVTIKNTSNVFSAGINVDSGFITTTSNNIFANTGVPLKTERVPAGIQTASYSFPRLPLNGREIVVGDVNMTSVSILDISKMEDPSGISSLGVSRSEDYLSVIIFKKALGSSSPTLDNLLPNTQSGSVQKIHLLNPDVDISDMNIIHFLIFDDGFNLCGIVTGYNDGSSST
jgi:hypothetical protein